MIPDFAQSLYERFSREGIPLLLAGGWAVCHHGYSRFTNDIDWICSRGDESRAQDVMKSLGFEIAFEAMATRFKHGKHLDLVPVDLLWVSPETFAKMEATDQMTGRHDDIPVINFETLLSMKLHALKDQVERRNKDLLDIFELLHENAGVIAEDKLREICARFGGPDAYKIIRRIP
ncbi:MAG: nucleotidyl transferase AbiEii/AbiGii toxin family protein [Verrucomicrobiota bacterium]